MVSAVSSAQTIPAYTSASGQADSRVSARQTEEKNTPQQQEDERRIAELAATDRKVRAHEAAHLAAAQGLAISGAQYSFEIGPDQKRYAVAGEVSIDTSEAHTPEATIIKAGHIRRAALASADPSSQDHHVAALADAMAANARIEVQRQQAARYTQGETPRPGSQIDEAA